MAAGKVERLINLIALLMETRRPLTPDQIRDAIYHGQSDVAFRRMFERDKEELREIGIPVDRAATDVWETEEGYLIRPEEAALPDIGLTPDEQAALWLAARMWRSEDDISRRALLKLSLSGSAPAPDADGPRLGDEPSSRHLPALLDAIAERRRVRFRYRTASGARPAKRVVEPHRLSYRGGWYLSAFDTGRGALRHFKLARVEGQVTPEPGSAPRFEPPSAPPPDVPHGPWEGAETAEARVAFGPTSAWWAERRTGARRVGGRADGWVELAIPVADRETFLGWVLGFADDAEILAPPDLRAAAVERLRRAAGLTA